MITFEVRGETVTVPESRIVEIRRLRPGRFEVLLVGSDEPITLDQEPTRGSTLVAGPTFEVWQHCLEEEGLISWLRTPVVGWNIETGVVTGSTESLKPISDEVDLPYVRGLLVDLRSASPRAKVIGPDADAHSFADWVPLHEAMEAITGMKLEPCEHVALRNLCCAFALLE